MSQIATYLKTLEASQETHLDPSMPYMVRLDGRCFSTFTKNFKKPVDPILVDAMVGATRDFVEEFRPVIGYTASDEASFVFLPHPKYEETGEGHIFSNRIQKITTNFASFFTARFLYHLRNGYQKMNPGLIINCNWIFRAHFDCRAYNTSIDDACLGLHWRQDHDTYRNGISALARKHFSTRDLHKKNRNDMLAMIDGVGDHLENYPSHLFHGTYIKKKLVSITVVDRHTFEEKPAFRTHLAIIDGKNAPRYDSNNLEPFRTFVMSKYWQHDE